MAAIADVDLHADIISVVAFISCKAEKRYIRIF